ncbi:SurA N-terminal domain-containing protein [Salinicoccus albus]|uniref:SurA N-terminal domain-containing protein n=1 Tax=Salinicoccus albus TaxID=418756 RepID=UPI000371924D|nr:SurA N-terminal domain-containing protein [Salinicoccus albus]
MKKWLLSLSIGTFAVVMTACGGGDESAENTDEGSNTQEEASGGSEESQSGQSGSGEQSGDGGQSGSGEQAQMPEPDLEGVPDVVAEVNGEEVTKEEFEQTYTGQFQQVAMQQQMSGEEVDQDQLKQQVAEGMVDQELLIQESNNRDISAPEEDVNAAIDQMVEQNGMESQDDFFAALEEQGMSEDEAMSQLETQVKVDQLIAEEAGDIEPTEEELQEAYDQAKEQQEQMGGDQEMPSFEEMKPDLEEQVKSQKESEAAQTLASELRDNSDVTVNV